MATFLVPTSASIHTSKALLEHNDFFAETGEKAVIKFNTSYMHLEPIGLAMIAAWGAWCKRNDLKIEVQNITRRADYAARMKLFEMLGIEYERQITEHEEIGRFLPLCNVKTRDDIRAVLADVSALLHLNENPDSLKTVQYCLSELLRNALEHSGSRDGAFVCAHNYTGKGPHRVTLAVADCGCGISQHLSIAHPKVKDNDLEAIRLAMQPGITGAIPGVYGTSDNAGAGLFITRNIAKGTGGYFEIISGNAAYRLRRTNNIQQPSLFQDAFVERCDTWKFPTDWIGTVVTLEIRTEMVNEFEKFFGWIRNRIPTRISTQKRIRFT
jgi:anti-sigma regulatory factor (Ser/Thr protein kinase)